MNAYYQPFKVLVGRDVRSFDSTDIDYSLTAIFDNYFVLGDTFSREEAASARFGRSAKGSAPSEAFSSEGIFSSVLLPS